MKRQREKAIDSSQSKPDYLQLLESMLSTHAASDDSGPLLVPLTCQVCGTTATYAVGQAIVQIDPEKPVAAGNMSDDYIAFQNEIRCGSCGAVDKYTLTADAHLTLMAELVTMTANHQLSNDRLRVVKLGELRDGRILTIRQAIADLQQKHQDNPHDTAVSVRLANTYHSIGRIDAAKEQYHRTLAIDPEMPEAHYNLAELAEKRGEHILARSYRQSLVRIVTTLQQPTVLELAIAREALELLEERQPLPIEQTYVVVGRNDLCPCGSGIKYKKCCGKQT